MTLKEQTELGDGLKRLEEAIISLKAQNELLRSRLTEWQQLAAAMRDCIGIEPFSVDTYNNELLVLARYEALKATIV